MEELPAKEMREERARYSAYLALLLILLMVFAVRFFASGGGEGTEKDFTPIKISVDINNATIDELTVLPGIGEELSSRIVAKRLELGGFREPKDIMLVSGIGEGKFRAMEDLIFVDTNPSVKGAIEK